MNALTAGAKKRLALHGPDRVIVDINGTAVSQFRAKTEFSTEADVILIRADGWMLGAPWKLLNYARSIWKDQWVEEIIINPDTRPKKKAPDANATPGPQPPAQPAPAVGEAAIPSPAQPASAAQDGAKPEEHAPVSTPKPAPPKKAPAAKVVKEVLQVGNPPDNKSNS